MTPSEDRQWQRAQALFQSGHLAESAQACEALLDSERLAAWSRLLLSSICLHRGQPRLAAFHALAARQRLEGADWQAMLATSSALYVVGEYELAHQLLDELSGRRGGAAPPPALLARQYNALEDIPAAMRCVDEALAQQPGDASLHYMRGLALGLLTEPGAALAAYEQAIALQPGHAQSHWARSQLAGVAGAEERIAALQGLLASAASDEDRAYAGFGLFREFDRLDRRDEAWQALAAGARARRAMIRYDPSAEAATYAAIAASNASLPPLPPPLPADEGQPLPVFIVGLPRTGTTLVERILGNHPEVQPCGELADWHQQFQWSADRLFPVHYDEGAADALPKLDYRLLGERYLRRTAWRRRDRRVFTDKNPTNFAMCGPILRALPQARILHLRRHPVDACFSNLKELFAPGYHRHSYDLAELAAHHRNYSGLMAQWHAQAPGRILDVQYEALVADPEGQAARILDYLGLAPASGLADIQANPHLTTTASAQQVREPIHQRHVGGWRRYAAPLQPLVEALAAESAAYPA